jgi:hypothetical protein
MYTLHTYELFYNTAYRVDSTVLYSPSFNVRTMYTLHTYEPYEVLFFIILYSVPYARLLIKLEHSLYAYGLNIIINSKAYISRIDLLYFSVLHIYTEKKIPKLTFIVFYCFISAGHDPQIISISIIPCTVQWYIWLCGW